MKDWIRRHQSRIWVILVVISFLSGTILSHQLSPTYIGPNTGAKGCDWIIQPDYTTNPVTYYAIDCQSSNGTYSGTTAETVINNAINNLPSDGSACSPTSCNDRVIVFKGTIILNGGTIDASAFSHIAFDLRDANITQGATATGLAVFKVNGGSYVSFVGPGNGQAGIINVGGKTEECIRVNNEQIVTINGIVCTNNGGGSFGIHVTAGSNNVTISNSYVYSISSSAIYSDAGPNNNLFLINNRIWAWDTVASGNVGVVDTPGIGSGSANWLIQGNQIGPSGGAGIASACISSQSSTRFIIENNILRNCRKEGMRLQGVDHYLISGNHVSNTGAGTSAPEISLDPSATPTSSFNVITNNYSISPTVGTADFTIHEANSANHDVCSYNVVTGESPAVGVGNGVTCAGIGSSAVGNVSI